MVAAADDLYGNMTRALRARGMYERTLIILSAGARIPFPRPRLVLCVLSCFGTIVPWLHQSCSFFIVGGLWASFRRRGECCADNGGPASIYASSHCANNWPLRGGKKTNFEGGIRTAAFVSGGFLPAAARGQLRDQYIHCADWYRTLCHLSGGVDCGDIVSSRKHDVPPVDGHDVWDYVIGANATSPRVEIMVSRCEV
jgi:arylsulfatase A-like enzyme